MELKIYKDKQLVAEKFSEFFDEQVKKSEEFHVALSGGSTPKIVFDFLAEKYADTIDWSKIFFYWGDERCVPADDEDSNYKMTKDHLLSKVEVPEENIFRIRGENEPDSEAIRYAELLKKELPAKNGIPQFDLVILGMGDDGHTASIFPNQMELWNADAYCKVATHPESGQKRVSLTGRIINNAKKIAFLVTGAGKAEKVEEIVGEKSGYKDYPASRVNPTSGELLWFLDKAAAVGLEK